MFDIENLLLLRACYGKQVSKNLEPQNDNGFLKHQSKNNLYMSVNSVPFS